jgi:hypothetical protein
MERVKHELAACEKRELELLAADRQVRQRELEIKLGSVLGRIPEEKNPRA